MLVGERTQLTARRLVRFGQPTALEVKGKTDPLIAYGVEGLCSGGEARMAALRSPLVGRARELNQLNGLLDETLETATPHFVLVYGPAGIGKSRLIVEFLAAARARRELDVLTGRCRATGRGITYWALAEILRLAFGIALDDPADVAAENVLRGARAALAGLELPEQELVRTVSALATTAGIPLPDDPLSELEPRLVVDELARAWPRFATALARQRPTIVVVEDLHWAGDPLLEMLARLIGRSDGSLLIVATARPEFAAARPSFVAGREGATAISLQSLTEAEGTALVEGLLQSVELSGESLREIVRTADGNPFFLEEIVLQMIDTGVIVRERDRWRASLDTAAIVLRDTVHGVIAARIDALAGDDKRVLQEAAVFGRRFWLEPLARVRNEAAVTSALLRLEERGLVVARPISSLSGQAEYQFKHALVRDVAYAGLLKARRARAHAEHAVWLEELASDRREELAELIAAHYTSALASEDADLAWADDSAGWQTARTRGFEALLAAGDAARRRFAVTRALELHEQALSLASGNALESGRALAALGDDHEAAYHGDEAFEAYLPALELLRGEPGADSLRAHICLMASRMAAVKWGGFRSKPTPELWDSLVDEGLAAARDDETHAWLTVLKGNVGVRRTRLRVDDPLSLDERLRFAEAGLDAAEQLDRPAVLSQSYRTAGLLHSLAGDWDRTLELARRDIRHADRLDPAEQAFALFWNALFFMEIAGEFRESAGYAERSLELARRLTPHERMHGTYTVMHSRYHLGTWSELDVLASEHVAALASEPGIGCPYARAGQLFAALGLAHQGQLDRAAELAAAFTPDLGKPALPEALLARYRVARGDAVAGRDLAEQIVGRPVYAEENAYEILATLEALVALEDWDALTAFLPRARAFSHALALVEPASERASGIVSAAAGDPATAEECLTRALERFKQLGAVFEAALTKERLAAVAPNGRATRLLREALAT